MPKTRLVTRLLTIWVALSLLGGCKAQGSRIGGAQNGTPSIFSNTGELERRSNGPTSVCPIDSWPDEAGACVPLAEAFIAEGGQTYWVDQRHGSADDRNPGTRERPWRTINRASSALRAGDAVIVQAGVYRESIQPRFGGSGPDRRITYAAAPGAEVVVSGADLAEPLEWLRDGNAWRRSWTGPELPTYDDEHGPVMRRELVAANGEVLRAVFRREELEPGTFFVEGPETAQRAVVARFPGDKPPGQAGPIEIAHRTFLFQPMGVNPYPECGGADTPGWLRVVGITFRHAANHAQWGAFCGGREGALVENVTVEWTNGAGVDGSGVHHVFRNVAANYNGQIGFVAACTGCLFEDTQAIGNNWKNYDPFWEAGGGKWRDTHQTIIRRHVAADNGGPGIWLDGHNSHNTIEGSVAVRNDVAGIMLELETTFTLVQHNHVAETYWHGYSGSGVLSQAASRNAFIHNTVAGNEGSGIWLRLDPDRRAADGHNILYNNVLVGNALSATEEAREISVEGLSLQHSRTNQFEGNVYGRHVINDLRTSTFFFIPDSASEADFRSGNLTRWQWLTGSDATARLVDPPTRTTNLATLQSVVGGQAAPLPEGLMRFGADGTTRGFFGNPGADPDGLPAGINLNRLQE